MKIIKPSKFNLQVKNLFRFKKQSNNQLIETTHPTTDPTTVTTTAVTTMNSIVF